MRFIIRLVTVVCSVLALQAPPADARRVALVIGNAGYKIGPLVNPVNDAEAVAVTFKSQLKFDQVILRKDLKLDGFREALRELARAAAGAELGVVFFAGHGIEVAGRNYLIPTDAALATPADIELEAIALDTVLRQLDGVTRLRLVILDACRNNPFPAAKRSATRGLGRVEPDGGTLIAYAAKDGTTADDGKAGRHSPFAAALLNRIVTPGLDVRLMFGFVADDVLAATGRAQEPHLYGRLGGEQVHLVAAVAADAKPLVVPSPPATDGAAQAWATAKDSTSIALLEAFRLEFGAKSAFYDRLAKDRIEALRGQQLALLKAEEEKKRDPALSVKPGSGKSFRDRTADGAPCPECPEMVVVPAGSFMMGSSAAEIAALKKANPSGTYDNEGPQRKVTVARPFAVGKFEVTFAEWDACALVADCRHRPSDQGWGRGRRPVINVSWNDAKEYVAWLSRKTGKTYRLLTEAEWEYAARAGTTTRYAFGDTVSWSQPQARFLSDRTVEVGSFPANKFGLHDTHGNVWEWVEDTWHHNYEGAPLDGTVWQGGDVSLRAIRGIAWGLFDDTHLRCAFRGWSEATGRSSGVGFRLARTL